jgi:hypothetical protein
MWRCFAKQLTKTALPPLMELKQKIKKKDFTNAVEQGGLIYQA